MRYLAEPADILIGQLCALGLSYCVAANNRTTSVALSPSPACSSLSILLYLPYSLPSYLPHCCTCLFPNAHYAHLHTCNCHLPPCAANSLAASLPIYDWRLCFTALRLGRAWQPTPRRHTVNRVAPAD